MTLLFIRIFFVILSSVIGYYLGSFLGNPILGTQLGCLSGLILILLEQKLQSVSVRGLSSMVFGLVLGLVIAKLLSDILSLLPLGEFLHSVLRVILTVIFSYFGAVMALRGKDEFNLIIPYIRFRRQDVHETVILLDTSAIIDGRVSDIYKIHFLAGRLVVPRFVLDELQKLSDSADHLKRQRGRRGMEILKQMQDDPKMDMHIHEDDFDVLRNLRQFHISDPKRIVRRRHENAPLKIDHRRFFSRTDFQNRNTPARIVGGVIRRPQDAGMPVQVRHDFFFVPNVIS